MQESNSVIDSKEYETNKKTASKIRSINSDKDVSKYYDAINTNKESILNTKENIPTTRLHKRSRYHYL